MKLNWRWLLLLTAIIGSIEHAKALKASALSSYKGQNGTVTKTTTTTSAPATTSADASNNESNNEEAENDEEASDVVTKPPLTGIPQIDYVWDPNLPRELNGYNLSSYPFLNSVPDNEDIDFKCDGLHDGFYASIKYSCQLYHHCVYGIRHDFLCANFTAFDQKSFICHFVSEVNCKNSAKYWFRNDALYKATTTTTTTTTTQAPPPTTEAPYRRPAMRNRPYRRRRPQPDYYYDDEEYDDDYVEERMNRRRRPNRPRPRRPEYDDEYDNPRTGYKDDMHEDDMYDQRSAPRSRPRDHGDEEYEYDRRPYDRPRSRLRPANKQRHNEDDMMDKRTPNQGRQFAENERRKPSEGRRNNNNDDRKGLAVDSRRGLNDDRKSLMEDRRPVDDRRPTYDDHEIPVDDRRLNTDEAVRRPYNNRHRPNTARRPSTYDDDIDPPPKKQTDYHQDGERERGHRPALQEDKVEIVPKVRASNGGSSIFNRPRAPPRISRPVPVNEKDKFQYMSNKQSAADAHKPAAEEVYDDEYDYEEEPPKPQPVKKEEKTEVKSSPSISSQKEPQKAPQKDNSPPTKAPIDEYEEYVDEAAPYEKPQQQQSSLPQQKQQQQQKQPERNIYQRPELVKNIAAKPKEVTVKPSVAPKEAAKEEEPAIYDDEEEIEYVDDEDFPENDEKAQPEIKVSQAPKPSLLSGETDRKSEAPTSYGSDASGPSSNFFTRNKHHRPVSISDRHSARIPAPVASTAPGDNSYSRREPTPESIRPSGFKTTAINEPVPHRSADQDEAALREYRPVVRVLKRPFLPSRGGNPYLARGLKPLGGSATDIEPTESPSIEIDTSAVSGLRLLEHSAPLMRHNQYDGHQIQTGPRTTQQPQIESPRGALDDLYNEEYDVTLNDVTLNPTLKPLSQTRGSPIGFSQSKYERINPYARADVAYSSSQLRSTVNHGSIAAPPRPPLRRYQSPPTAHGYYSDEVDY